MQPFLDFVIKGLVDRPDAVSVTPVDRNGMTIYELRVHPTDMGKIIGRQGATINAIRALLLVGSAKRGLRCALEVVDEEGGGERRERPERSGDRSGSRPPSRGHDRGGERRGGFRAGRSESSPTGDSDRPSTEFSESQPARDAEDSARSEDRF